MKKITLSVLITVFGFSFGFGQTTNVFEAPLDNASTTQVRAPNGLSTYAYHRAVSLVLASDLTYMPAGSNITAFGYTLTNGATVPAIGNFTIYLQNTSDLTYLKGTNWTTALTSMTMAYASVMTIPMATGTSSILVTLSTPVTYTGGGLYVATDWYSAGPYSTTPATYLADNGLLLNPGCASANSAAAPAPTALTNTAFRPSFLFGFTNTYSNDISVLRIEAPGKVAVIQNTPHNIVGVIRNTSSVTVSNLSVSLTVAGANPFTNTQIVPSLAAGAWTSVPFSAFNPVNPGANTITVFVPADQFNTNNSRVYTQSVTCSTWAQNPIPGTYNNAIGFNLPGGIFVCKMVNPVTSTLSGINFGVSSDLASVGVSACGVLMNSTGVILATTNTITLTSPMLGTVQNFQFSPNVMVSPATTYYIGVAQLPTTALAYPAGSYYVPYIVTTNYFTTALTGGALTALPPHYGYFDIEAVFTPSMSVAASPSVTCSGETAILSVNGPATYVWTQGSTPLGSNQPLTVSPLVTTIYSVTGTNTLGCIYSSVITLSVNPLPVVNINSPANTLCLGASLSFTANGAVSYSLNGTATPSVISQTPLASTGYTVTGIDANGCVNTTSLGVTVFSLTVTFPANAAVCKGKSVTLSVGPATYGYVWTDGVIVYPFQSPSFTPSVTTVYTITASDVNNCSISSTVMVTVNPNPTVTAIASKTTICKGESVTLTASGAATYTWNGTVANSAVTLSPITPTSYVVVGTTTSGCTNTLTVVQLVNPCTALKEGTNTNAGIAIFPNPGSGIFNLSFENFKQSRTIEIYNSLGSMVKRFGLNSENAAFDLSNESNGIYFVQVIEENKTSQVIKIIKQ